MKLRFQLNLPGANELKNYSYVHVRSANVGVFAVGALVFKMASYV